MALLQQDGSSIRKDPGEALLYQSARAALQAPPAPVPTLPVADPTKLIRPLRDQVREATQKAIESALILCQGRKKKTAQCLGISYRMLYYHMRRFT